MTDRTKKWVEAYGPQLVAQGYGWYYLGFLVSAESPSGFASDQRSVWRCIRCNHIAVGDFGELQAPFACDCADDDSANPPGRSEDTA